MQNKNNLREKYSLMNLLGRSPMEVADPIAYMSYFEDEDEDVEEVEEEVEVEENTEEIQNEQENSPEQ